MRLDHILQGIAEFGERPPLDEWAPALSGEMDLVIARDGRWVHEGRDIERPELVRLFARILRRESDGQYYLVTPVEKWRIQVEDTAFVVVDADYVDPCWWLTTNVGERVSLGNAARLTLTTTPMGEWVPEVGLPFGLSARLGRNVFYRLVELAEVKEADLGIHSEGVWQPLGRLEGESR